MKDFLNAMIRKLSSRKLWMAIAVVATGISVAFGNDATEIQTTAGALTALIGSIVYIITEGKIDAAHIVDIANPQDVDNNSADHNQAE